MDACIHLGLNVNSKLGNVYSAAVEEIIKARKQSCRTDATNHLSALVETSSTSKYIIKLEKHFNEFIRES